MSCLRSAAFSLLELVVVMGILMLMSTTGLVGYAKIMNVKAQVETKSRLYEARDAYLDYYRQHGVLPSTLADFASYASSPGNFRDGWNRPLHLITNVRYADASGPLIDYDAVIISTGTDDVVSTTVDTSSRELTVSSADIVILVSVNSIRLEKQLQATRELEALISAALTYYSTHDGIFPTLISQIAPEAGLTRQSGTKFVDPWLKPFRITSGSSAVGGYFEIASSGSSRDFSETSDNIQIGVTLSQLLETPYEQTRLSLSRANTALQTYLSAGTNPSHLLPDACTDNSSTCAAALCSDFLDGTDAVDYWGTPLYFDLATKTFYSAGEDLDATTTADNLSL